MTDPEQQQNWISGTRLGAASTVLALAVMLVPGIVATAQAQTYTVLYSFQGGTDGGYPSAGLVRDKANNLYGTTMNGGVGGYGTVFKVDTNDIETVLHSFTGGADGGYPTGAGLVRNKIGNLFGTTEAGGDLSCGVNGGCGTVFKVDTSGTETVLYSFTGGMTDGCAPQGGMLLDKTGNLYGTTVSCGFYNLGTVIRLDSTGKETVLHSFAGPPYDGINPSYTSLLMDKMGTLYGVTEEGGRPSNYGTVYKLSKSGLTLLDRFAGGRSDGCDVLGTPTMDEGGNLYGTTISCGFYSYGIVWKVSKKHRETVLHNFAGGTSDGANPNAGVIMDANGNLYGDTTLGGSANLGTVYKIDKGGTLSLLHSFAGADGQYPIGGVIRDAKGTLYGTTSQGGGSGQGTVWKLTP